jgi:L-lactate utilization protein LutC
MNRDAFLARLRTRLGRGAGGAPPPAPHPAPPQPELTGTELPALFTARLEALGVGVVRTASREEALNDVERLVTERGWRAVCGPAALRTPELGFLWVDDPKVADVGLAEADWAVAETGTVVLLNRGDAARGHSLLPLVSVFVVPESRILPRLGDALRRLGQAPEELPACVSFVSGPSNTTDINATRCVGVHGPGEVHAWIVAGE